MQLKRKKSFCFGSALQGEKPRKVRRTAMSLRIGSGSTSGPLKNLIPLPKNPRSEARLISHLTPSTARLLTPTAPAANALNMHNHTWRSPSSSTHGVAQALRASARCFCWFWRCAERARTRGRCSPWASSQSAPARAPSSRCAPRSQSLAARGHSRLTPPGTCPPRAVSRAAR